MREVEASAEIRATYFAEGLPGNLLPYTHSDAREERTTSAQSSGGGIGLLAHCSIAGGT